MTKVLLVGGGGREHALAWKFRQDDPSIEIVAAPGNPGIATIARCVAVKADDIEDVAKLAERERVDATVVGPEGPLAAGIVDRFRSRGLPIFGPARAAAEIETSKTFSKELMLAAGVPTARATAHRSANDAKEAARAMGAPVVIKASGLAAGKGVVVAGTLAEADRAIDAMLGERVFGGAGDEILVEEYMDGEELSIFALTDGTDILPMIAAQDHKRLLPGDVGPNTGGMGAYAPVSIATPEVARAVNERVFLPTLAALRRRGRPFTGLLYAGLMLCKDGPRVVEFNCRFGDPETQALLPLLESSLLEPVLAIARGQPIGGLPPLRWKAGASVTTVVSAQGYPESPRMGDPIALPDEREGVTLFHAGTKVAADSLISAGGRVLAVTAVAPSFDEARRRSREAAAAVRFEGRHFRDDIGWREAARRSAS